MKLGGHAAIDDIRKQNPSKEIRVIDGEISVDHDSLKHANEAIDEPKPNLGRGFFQKSKNYVEITKHKRDKNKFS